MRQHDLSAAAALSEAAGGVDRVDRGLAVYVQFQRAEIHALSGERLDAVRELATADGLIDQLPPPEELPGSGYWYTPGFFLGQQAFVLDVLGDRVGARDATRACLAEMPGEWASAEWAQRCRALADA